MTQSPQITSIKDERVAEARELTSVAGCARLHKVQLEGEESVQWALDARLLVEHVFYSAQPHPQELLDSWQTRGIPCYAVSEGILKKISDTTYLVPIIGIARLPPEPNGQGPSDDFVLVVDRVNVTGQMIMQAFDHALHKATDLNGWQVVLLMMLACDRQMTREHASRDTATFGLELDALLRPLLDRQYITLTQANELEILQITPEGERILAQLWTIVEKSESEVLSGFSEQEKSQLVSYLKRIQANCTALIEE